MKTKLTGLILSAGLLLGACTVGPNYTPPKPVVAPVYSEVPAESAATPASRMTSGSEALARWWLVFNDPELNSLIERAARDNRDLQQAVSRVREARAQRAMVSAGLWPEINTAAGYDRGHGSRNVELPFGGGKTSGGASGASSTASRTTPSPRLATGGAAPSGDVPPASSVSGGGAAPNSPLGQGGLPGVTTNLYQAGFDASWEIDVFGGTRRALEAADASVAAAEEAQRGVLVSLLAEVATTYVELRAVQQRLQIAHDNLAAQRDAAGVIDAKFKVGLATELDAAQENAQVSTTEAALPALEAAERTSAHALAFLIGATPDALVAELTPVKPLPSLPPEVPVGVPSDLLRRRPDIRHAERELAAATAGVGVATADLWPKFNLTGAFGFDSSDPKHLGDWSSHYYSIAPGISWPILDWGKVRANIRVENERQQQAFLGYQNTVSQALRDVEDALVNYSHEQTRRASLANAVTATRRAYELARQRFEHGVIDLLTTLETQRTLLQSEEAMAESDSALRRDLIALYKALGGGWEAP